MKKVNNILKESNNSCKLLDYITNSDYYEGQNGILCYHKVPVVIKNKILLVYNEESKRIRRRDKESYEYLNFYKNTVHFNFLLDLLIEEEGIELIIENNGKSMIIKDGDVEHTVKLNACIDRKERILDALFEYFNL